MRRKATAIAACLLIMALTAPVTYAAPVRTITKASLVQSFSWIANFFHFIPYLNTAKILVNAGDVGTIRPSGDVSSIRPSGDVGTIRPSGDVGTFRPGDTK